MTDVLQEIIASTRAELAERKASTPQAELEAGAADRLAAGDFRDFAAALRAPGLSVIAEHKRSSPSAGVIREGSTLEEVVSAYERGGAAALSILTERTRFSGTLDDLRAARVAAGIPLLRKDFVVDPYQLFEAAAAGADAVLLIVAGLERDPLWALYALAGELGLAALVEVHNAAELDIALELGPEIIGINNRNLSTLVVDTETTFTLRERIPAGTVVVGESGFSRPDQMLRLAEHGVDAVLIGEALMRSPDLEAACRELTAAVPAR